jgi:hypothetical protein
LGAVNVVQDGWWNRAKGGSPGLTSPSLPFPVPDNGLAVSASNGEAEKVAAVGLTITVDPSRFARLILNLRETTASGANAGTASSGASGTVGGAVRACPASAAWVGVKNGEWAKQPTFDANACVNGARSSDTPATWSFDISAMALRWLAGTLEQNGVVLVENVSAPATFQAAWGDRTTPDLTVSVDLVPEEEPSPAFEDIPSDSGGFTDTPSDTSTAPAPVFSAPETFEFSSQDSFTTPQIRPSSTVPPPASTGVATPIANAAVPRAAVEPNVLGNIPLGVVLMVLLGAAVAIAASFAMGPAGNPSGIALQRQGGVSRALAQRRTELPVEAPNP